MLLLALAALYTFMRHYKTLFSIGAMTALLREHKAVASQMDNAGNYGGESYTWPEIVPLSTAFPAPDGLYEARVTTDRLNFEYPLETKFYNSTGREFELVRLCVEILSCLDLDMVLHADQKILLKHITSIVTSTRTFKSSPAAGHRIPATRGRKPVEPPQVNLPKSASARNGAGPQPGGTPPRSPVGCITFRVWTASTPTSWATTANASRPKCGSLITSH